MRFLLGIGVCLALVGAGCGGGESSPESVVRAWSSTLNAGDNEGAADLFAPNARIIQGGAEQRFRSRADAVAWNAGLPCSGRIVRIVSRADTVTATFVLGDRETSRCDAPGAKARAVVRVRGGKIVLWHQVPVPEAPPLRTTPVV
ncbi:MAG: nuclear transport factor 2 family protein [Actinomycetota bacterium]|nr:nuclear transport factor 2 family protein [Actinomycetota bacterium]